MTFDLFDEFKPTAAPVPAPAPQVVVSGRAEGESFMMEPTGELNRWLYRGVAVIYDNRRKPGSELGLWRSVEGVGRPVMQSDDRIEVCRAIDAYLAGAST